MAPNVEDRKRVVLVGAGGLGSAAAFALARSQRRRALEIVILDADRVEPSNLHRQILHTRIGVPKARSAAAAIAALSPETAVIPVEERLTAANAARLLDGADVVLDGADNFATKFLVNDACVIAGIPFVHAGAVRWGGQLLAVDPRRGEPEHPCYRCLFEAPPPAPANGDGASCAEAGVVGPVVGVIGALAGEAALLLLDGRAPGGTLRIYDGLAGVHRAVRFHRNPACVACGPRATRALDPAGYESAPC